MGLFDFFKKKRNYSEGSDLCQDPKIRRIFMQTLGAPTHAITARDVHYLALREDHLRALVWKYHAPAVGYHQNSDEFPDCDDFALMARGSVMYGASMEGIRYTPLFGGISYLSKRLDGWHRANWAITADEKLWIFEPQSEQQAWYPAASECAEFRMASI